MAMIDFPLNVLCDALRLAALDLPETEPDTALTAARWCDGLRDAGLPVPSIDAWTKWTAGFDAHAWQRMEILVRLFRESPVAGQVVACLKLAPEARPQGAFVDFCTREAQLLTRELLLKSVFRVEEMARKWVHALGGTIDGEKPQESEAKMERLDFGGVLKNLKAADTDRAARMKKLKEIEAKRLKEQQEAYEKAGRE